MSVLLLSLLLACTSGKDEPADSGDSGAGDSGDSGAGDSGDSGTGDSGDTGAGDSGDTGADEVSKEDRATIERKLNRALGLSNASAAQLAVWKGDHIILTLTVGETYEGSGVPITDETLFQCGSDTKKMTALLALRQVAAGGFALDDTVDSVLGGYSLTESPRWAGEVTVHDLLSHQGGLYDYTPWSDAPDDAVLGDVIEGDAADRLWAMAPPGAFWNYANPNFSYAGYLVEAVDGRPWGDILEADLFAPLGMTHSYARAADAIATGEAIGGVGYTLGDYDALDPFADYEYTFGYLAPEDHGDNAFTRPAGLVWTTASDLARLGAFLLDGDSTIVPDDLREELTTAHADLYPGYPGLWYGYGMFLQQGISLTDGYHDVALWSHGGNTLTQTSLSWWLPEQGMVIQILSNGYGDDFSLPAVTVIELLAGLDEPTDPPDGTYVETDHALLAGTYVDPVFGPMIVTDDDGLLLLDMPVLSDLGYHFPVVLSPVWTDLYAASALGLDLTFIQAGGQYTYARTRSFVGTRGISELAPAASTVTRAQVEAALRTAQMDRLPRPGDALRPLGQ